MSYSEIVSKIKINCVVVLDSDRAGDLYMEKLYPRWIEPIVYTIEGKYPYDKDLRQKCEYEFANNPNLTVFAFGSRSATMKTLSQKKLNMFSFFRKDLMYFNWQKPILDFDVDKIIHLMTAFYMPEDLDRITNYENQILAYDSNSVKWYHHLLF